MEEICIAGGGVKGIAFLGALYELEINGLLDNIKKYSGTSIGGFFAILLVIGYKPKEIIDDLFEIDLSLIKDVEVSCILKNKSLMKGDNFKQFIKKFIKKKEKLETTLKELYEKTKKELIITVTCVDKGEVEYISYKTDPELSIYKLVCMTTSIPFIFPPILYNNMYYADGGIIDNLPLKVLKYGSWGISSTSSKINDKNEFSFVSYIVKILHIIYSNLQKKTIEEYKNIIKVDVKHINVTSFDITNDEKLMLVHNGRKAIKENLETILNSLK